MQNNQSADGTEMRIDINDEKALTYWSAALQVSAEDLKKAVTEVGPMIGDVCRKLHVGMR
ncbi:MAG: DUF3606 domain-containing protein [Chitinophagaceae bacterium]|nr:MAG: DUF3606 domain-containing protein [Chitinophagaceae bacterium]